MRKGMLAIVLAACAACGGGGGSGSGSGGGGSGSASVNGTIGGQSMSPRDAISNVLRNSTDSVGIIFISSADSLCAKINARQQPRNMQVMVIEIGTQSSTAAAAPAGPGVFPVYSSIDSTAVVGPVAIAFFLSSNASCRQTASFESATGGNVTLTRVDASGYAGTFDLTFSGGAGQVTGSFSTGRCTALRTNLGGTCT